MTVAEQHLAWLAIGALTAGPWIVALMLIGTVDRARRASRAGMHEALSPRRDPRPARRRRPLIAWRGRRAKGNER